MKYGICITIKTVTLTLIYFIAIKLYIPSIIKPVKSDRCWLTAEASNHFVAATFAAAISPVALQAALSLSNLEAALSLPALEAAFSLPALKAALTLSDLEAALTLSFLEAVF